MLPIGSALREGAGGKPGPYVRVADTHKNEWNGIRECRGRACPLPQTRGMRFCGCPARVAHRRCPACVTHRVCPPRGGGGKPGPYVRVADTHKMNGTVYGNVGAGLAPAPDAWDAFCGCPARVAHRRCPASVTHRVCPPRGGGGKPGPYVRVADTHKMNGTGSGCCFLN